MEEIARIAGVSKSTVSNALSGKDTMLSSETKAKISRIAEENGYKKRNRLLRFIIFEQRDLPPEKRIDHSPRFQLLYNAMKEECDGRHYQIVVNHIRQEDRLKGFRYIQDLSDCDGMIILGWELSLNDLEWLRSFTSLPFVIIDAFFTNPKYDFIASNNIDAAFQLTERMILYGHKRIGFIHGGILEVFNERMRGYQNALLSHNLDYDRQIVCRVERTEKSVFVDEIREFLLRLAKRNKPMPTAFVACDDRIAVSLLAVAEALNMKFTVAGFDNLPLCIEQTPPLTSVEPDLAYTGRTAVRRMIDKIEFSDSATQKIYTEPIIYFRGDLAELNK